MYEPPALESPQDDLDGRGGNDFLYSNSGEDRLIASAFSNEAEMTGGPDADPIEITDFAATGALSFSRTGLVDATGALSFSRTGLVDATGLQVRVLQALGDGSATLGVDHDGDGAAEWSVDIAKTDPMHLIGIDDLVP